MIKYKLPTYNMASPDKALKKEINITLFHNPEEIIVIYLDLFPSSPLCVCVS